MCPGRCGCTQALFDELDADGNGSVDRREWGRAVAKHAEALNTSLFGSISGGGMHSKWEASQSQLAAIGKAFNKIDADGSGTLTWDEFERFVGVR